MNRENTPVDLHQRLTQLELRLKRSHEHLLNVMASQRERTDQAFDEVKMAMREQQARVEAAMREQQTRTEKAFDQVKLAMLEQDLGVRAHVQEIGGAVGELAEAVKDHEERTRGLEDKPPAA